MRSKTETPSTKTEQEIETILVDNGYRIEDIQFRETWSVSKPVGDRYLRVGYWNNLSDSIIEQLGDRIKTTDTFYDDDCGYLFKYDINPEYAPKS
jgi:hypothetical protein